MLATLAAALLAAAPAPKAQGPVALVFAWPDGAGATRSERAEVMGTLTGQRQEQEVHLGVTSRGGEVRVRIGGGPEAALPPLTLVAAPDGALLRLEGEDAFRQALVERARRDPVASFVRGVEGVAEQFATSLLVAERTRWTDDVARWAGKTLAPGESREELAPPRGAGGLAARVRYGLRGTLPCPGDASRTCVELWATEVTDEDARRRACAGDDALAESDLLASTLELVVLAEAATLLPHRVTWSSRSRAACPGGLALPGESTAKAERTWAWRR